MKRVVQRFTAVTLVLLLSSAPFAAALEVHVNEVRTAGQTVRAALELHNALSEKLREILSGGGTLHIRLQAELWEDRPLWDRLVRPAVITTIRVARDAVSAQIALAGEYGTIATYSTLPDALPLRIDVAPAAAVSDSGKYYLRILVTVGTLADREAESTSDAVFGKDEGTVTLGRVGKLIFNTVLQASDYLQSVSGEARSRRFEGRELRSGVR
jgi:hypothetical protein